MRKLNLALISICTLLSLTAFASKSENIPVYMHKGIDLSGLSLTYHDKYELDKKFSQSGMKSYFEYLQSHVNIKLSEQIGMLWASDKSYKVSKPASENNKEMHAVANSCKSVLRLFPEGYWPYSGPDQSQYFSQYSYCKVLEIALALHESKKSYVSTFEVTKDSIKKLPKVFAHIPSSKEYDRVQKNPKIKTLEDATPIIKFTPLNHYAGEAQDSSGGKLFISLRAKGDFNGDGIEDLVINVTNSVVGGTYLSYIVYIMTKDKKDGDWILLARYPKD